MNKIFENKKVRTLWDAEEEKWYLSIVDVIEILIGTDRPRKYCGDLKAKLKKGRKRTVRKNRTVENGC